MPYVAKASTIGGVKSLTRYSSMLAGNPVYSPAAFDSIATYSVGAGGSTGFDFTSIPQTYQHLQIRTFHRQPVDKDLYLRVNSDFGSNYSAHSLLSFGNGSVVSGAVTSGSFIEWAYDGNLGNTSSFFSSVIDIFDYTSTSKYKTIKFSYGTDANGSGLIQVQSGNWRSNSAITSIQISTNGAGSNSLVQHSHFALYGIKGVA